MKSFVASVFALLAVTDLAQAFCGQLNRPCLPKTDSTLKYRQWYFNNGDNPCFTYGRSNKCFYGRWGQLQDCIPATCQQEPEPAPEPGTLSCGQYNRPCLLKTNYIVRYSQWYFNNGDNPCFTYRGRNKCFYGRWRQMQDCNPTACEQESEPTPEPTPTPEPGPPFCGQNNRPCLLKSDPSLRYKRFMFNRGNNPCFKYGRFSTGYKNKCYYGPYQQLQDCNPDFCEDEEPVSVAVTTPKSGSFCGQHNRPCLPKTHSTLKYRVWYFNNGDNRCFNLGGTNRCFYGRFRQMQDCNPAFCNEQDLEPITETTPKPTPAPPTPDPSKPFCGYKNIPCLPKTDNTLRFRQVYFNNGNNPCFKLGSKNKCFYGTLGKMQDCNPVLCARTVPEPQPQPTPETNSGCKALNGKYCLAKNDTRVQDSTSQSYFTRGDSPCFLRPNNIVHQCFYAEGKLCLCNPDWCPSETVTPKPTPKPAPQPQPEPQPNPNQPIMEPCKASNGQLCLTKDDEKVSQHTSKFTNGDNPCFKHEGADMCLYSSTQLAMCSPVSCDPNRKALVAGYGGNGNTGYSETCNLDTGNPNCSNDASYCDPQMNQNGYNHTGCAYCGVDDDACNNRVCGNGITKQADKDAIVAIHNKLRSKIAMGQETGKPKATDMNALVWDDQLAYLAQRWSEQCSTVPHDSNRRSVGSSYDGQNRYDSWSSTVDDVRDYVTMVQGWYDEVDNFKNNLIPMTFSDNAKAYPADPDTTKRVIGHFTQVAWAKTTKVGCGYTMYVDPSDKHRGAPNRKIFVCNYGEGGNFRDEVIYTVGDTAGSACQGMGKTVKNGLCV